MSHGNKRSRSSSTFLRGILVLGIMGVLWAGSTLRAVEGEPPSNRSEVQLHGKMVCLPEALEPEIGDEVPGDHTHVYGLRTTDGTYYTLLETRRSAALFEDEALRQKELLLTGKVISGSKLLRVTKIESIHDGTVHDVYYYCDLCAIEAIAPGPCMCCQGPLERVEEPVRTLRPD